MKTLMQQYKLVESAREALFTYLSNIPFQKLHSPVETANNKSVCYLLNHTAVTYLSWLNEFALKNPLMTTDETAWQTVNDVKTYYNEVDDCVYNFLAAYDDKDIKITGYKKSKDTTLTFSVLQLFTHVITHEFHHKGIILNMTRQLGYTPIETDIIRT